MKRQLHITIILFLTMTLSFDTYGQCIANAGLDTPICVGLYGLDSINLGGNPTVTGGTPPYTYTWSCSYTIIMLTYTASYFLDDTTSANPRLTNHNSDTLTFYLTVTDSLGNTCTDEIVVNFCQFVFMLQDKFAYINEGDTTLLYPGVGQGCSPLTVQWSPNYNISDPNIPNPLVWPDTTTYYFATVTDAAGCQAIDETFEVYVSPTGIHEYQMQVTINIFPNPMTDYSIIKTLNPHKYNLTLEFYDILGRKIKQMKIINPETELKRSDYNVGIYFYRLFSNDIPIDLGRLIIE